MTSLEDQVQAYRELARQIADLEKKRRELGVLLLQQMQEKSMTVGHYTLRRYERFYFRTSIEEARELGATKTEEIVDTDALKKLCQSGQSVPGASTVSFVQVSERKSPPPDPTI